MVLATPVDRYVITKPRGGKALLKDEVNYTFVNHGFFNFEWDIMTFHLVFGNIFYFWGLYQVATMQVMSQTMLTCK